MDREEEVAVELMDAIHNIGLLPYWEAAQDLSDMEAELPGLCPFAQLNASSLAGTLVSRTGFEARLDLARLGLLVEQYHARHRTYPESLAAIADGLDGQVPIDPFTGEPLHYRPREDGFALYSVGANRVDDGGRAGRSYNSGDIVWRREFEDDEVDGAEATD